MRLTQWFIGLWLPRDWDGKDPAFRQRCGMAAGLTGVCLNLLLFVGKLAAGLVTGSIAVVADAVNNLSDAAASVVTLAGFHLAGRKADAEHPFGHARMEYLAGLVVALAILLMGLEIGKTSVQRIFRPDPVTFSWPAAAVLAVAILVKLWLNVFYKDMAGRLDSAAMQAAATDSLADAASTGVVLFSALAGWFWNLYVDAFAGLLVAAFILRAGWEAARDTINPLLGRPMDPELARDIDALVLSHPHILGIHDLIYHDYGPGRAMMSFHAEVPADGDLLELHDLIDHIERELASTHAIETVIHMDPVVRDERTDALRRQVEDLARALDPVLSVHDLRVTAGPRHTNVIFDVVIPYGFPLGDRQVKQSLAAGVRALPGGRYYPVIQIDHAYVSPPAGEDEPG